MDWTQVIKLDDRKNTTFVNILQGTFFGSFFPKLEKNVYLNTFLNKLQLTLLFNSNAHIF